MSALAKLRVKHPCLLKQAGRAVVQSVVEHFANHRPGEGIRHGKPDHQAARVRGHAFLLVEVPASGPIVSVVSGQLFGFHPRILGDSCA